MNMENNNEGILFKSLTRPVMFWGVPIAFFWWNVLFWAAFMAFTKQFNQYPIMYWAVTHGLVAIVLIEHPSILKQLLAFLKCKFRNFKRGTFGATYYSPIDYSKSWNANVKK